MTRHGSDEYLRNAVLTARPEQLQMMLYDGAIRFTRQAREAMLRSQWEVSCDRFIRAQQIVSEMQNGLRPEVNPTLCEQLASLYGFIHRRLVDANVAHDLAAVDEALQILEHQRETWRMLVEKTSGIDPDSPGFSAERVADERGTFSLQG